MSRYHKIGTVKTMAKNKPAKGGPRQGNCGPEGNATTTIKRREDMLKNRNNAPTPAQIDPQATLANLVAPSRNDESKWNETKGAKISGYLAAAHYGGPESCNCHSNNPQDLDIHMELVTDLRYSNDESKYFIAELTRYFPALRKDLTPDIVKGKYQGKYLKQKITVTGWLFFDPDHMHEAENTNPGGAHNWRATSWEIHPITSIVFG